MRIINPIKGCVLKKWRAGHIYQGHGESQDLYRRALSSDDYDFVAGHNGLDISPIRDPMKHDNLVLATTGKVVEVKNTPSGYGKHVRILTLPDENGDYCELTYGHFKEIFVKVGQEVNDYEVLGVMGNCFDKETEILTDEGWKYFSELNQKEKVATLDPETNEVEYHLPVSYTKKKVKKMWYFKNYHSMDFAVTGNHTMYVEKQDGKMHFINFEDLPKFSWVKQSGGIWNGEEVEEFTIPECALGVNQTDAVKKVPSITIPMDLWLEFLGWWVSDGSINKNRSSVCITQSFNNQHKRDKIEELLDQLPFEVRRNREDYLIYSSQLARFLATIAPNKEFPKFIKHLSARQIRIFLDSFWLGDGWRHKATKYYITPLQSSANDLQELIMKCGGYATIKEVDPTKVNRKTPAMIGNQEVISRLNYFQVTEGQHRMGMIKKDMAEERDYDDYAYCLTVKNHIIYVRRGGRPMWCGNTGFIISGNTPYWGDAPAGKGVHLHLTRRDCSTILTPWQSAYSSGDTAYIKNYNNGGRGSVDPLPIMWTDSLLATLAEFTFAIEKLIWITMRAIKGRSNQKHIL